MKTRILFLVCLTAALMGCDREPAADPVISLVSASACKKGALKSSADHPSDQDCIQYKWISSDSLLIKHVNAAFNCCPDGFGSAVRMSGDTIIITESEKASLCDCNCLFDLNLNIAGIGRDTWWIRVEEPYVQQPGDVKLVGKLDLKKVTEGEFCLTRSGYPWGL